MITIPSIYKKLHTRFGPQFWWPTITGERSEIIIGSILTQNTSWRNVEKAIKNLHDRNLLTISAIRNTPEKELAKLIRPAGYFNQKAKKLKAFANYNDVITRESLLNMWGIGKETADSILLYAYYQPYFVVDAYTIRIMSRLGFHAKGYDEWQEMFHKNLPKKHKLYNEFHALLVELGKSICKKEPLCHECPLRKSCNYAKTLKA